MKIVFTGGGSGGHVLPIISIIRQLKNISPYFEKNTAFGKKKEELEIFYVGPKEDMNILLEQEGIKVKNIISGKIRRYATPLSILQNIFDLFILIPIGILQSILLLLYEMPDCKLAFSKGGYGAFPFTIGAWIMGVPIFMHESDSVPGLTNKRLAEIAKVVFASFPAALDKLPKNKTILVGNPIRQEIIGAQRDPARNVLGIAGEKPVIFFIGGSQGSQRFNDFILNNLPRLLAKYEIIHQTGAKNFEQVKAEAKLMISQGQQSFYHPFGFMNDYDYANALSACDVVVSRSGAGSIFEIASAGKPAILIPLPEAAQNHQFYNADAYARTGAAIVIEEGNFAINFFTQQLDAILNDKTRMAQMNNNANNFARPQAAMQIATYIRDFLAAV